MTQGAISSDPGVSHEALHEIDGTIDSLSRLLADMREAQAQHDAETAALEAELEQMRRREASLSEALTRLRHWLALDTEAMLSARKAPSDAINLPTPRSLEAGLAGLEAGAEQLRAEADSNRQIALIARRSRKDAEQTIDALNQRVRELEAQVDSVTRERDGLRERLDEQERLFEAAGLEIEWRPAKPRRSR